VTVTVLLFARYGEAAHASSLEVEVPEGARLKDVWARVVVKVPALAAEDRPLFSCDRTYARDDRVITGREEIGVFPPVSGG
jgi:molybdopterin converting factor small subunit